MPCAAPLTIEPVVQSKISVWIDSCEPASRAALEKAIRDTGACPTGGGERCAVCGGPNVRGAVAVGPALLDEMNVALDWTGHQQLLDKEHSKETFQPGARGKRRLNRPPSIREGSGSH